VPVRGFFTRDQKVRPITGRQTSISDYLSAVENAARKELLKEQQRPALVEAQVVNTGSIPDTISAPGPQDFKTYAQGGQSFEVSEAEFIQYWREKERRRIEGNMKYFATKWQEAGLGDITQMTWEKMGAQRIPKKFQDLYLGWRGNKARLDAYDYEKNITYNKQKLHDQYIETVKKAISTGKPVPEAVIKQYPEFRKAKDARLRYEKGLHTSFANKSAAVNAVMQAELGYKVKRQDGNPIADSQIKEIGQGVRDVEKVVGSLKEVLQKEDLTIAHTSGKFPFLRGDASGLYHVNERTVTTGLQIGPFKVHSLAHELGHALDYAGGRKNDRGYETYMTPGTYRTRQVPSTRVAVSVDEKLLMEDALFKMNGSRWSIQQAIDTKDEKMSQEQKDAARFLQAKIGRYWSDSREVFARMFEQYVAEEAGGPIEAAEPPEVYHKLPAYWRKEVFAEFKPRLKAEIERRLQLARGQ